TRSQGHDEPRCADRSLDPSDLRGGSGVALFAPIAGPSHILYRTGENAHGAPAEIAGIVESHRPATRPPPAPLLRRDRAQVFDVIGRASQTRDDPRAGAGRALRGSGTYACAGLCARATEAPIMMN